MKLRRGFTMIEMLVVMAVLAILAVAVMPLGETVIRAQKERELRRALAEIRDALDAYKRAADQGLIPVNPGASGFPPNLETLVEGAAPRSAESKRLFFLRRVPRDPFADPTVPAPQTWLLRSYASGPEQPRPGADVYDIRSSSKQLALDGSAYASW